MVAVAQSETLRTETLGTLGPVTMLSLVTQMCRIWKKNAGEDLMHCFIRIGAVPNTGTLVNE